MTMTCSAANSLCLLTTVRHSLLTTQFTCSVADCLYLECCDVTAGKPIFLPHRQSAKCQLRLFDARNIAANQRTVLTASRSGALWKAHSSVAYSAARQAKTTPAASPTRLTFAFIHRTDHPAPRHQPTWFQRHVVIGRRRAATHTAAANHATPPWYRKPPLSSLLILSDVTSVARSNVACSLLVAVRWTVDGTMRR